MSNDNFDELLALVKNMEVRQRTMYEWIAKLHDVLTRHGCGTPGLWAKGQPSHAGKTPGEYELGIKD